MEVQDPVTREIVPLVIGKRQVELPLESRAECRALIRAVALASERLPDDGEDVFSAVPYAADDEAWEKHLAHKRPVHTDDMSGSEIAHAHLDGRDRDDLEHLLLFISGYCPAALADALGAHPPREAQDGHVIEPVQPDSQPYPGHGEHAVTVPCGSASADWAPCARLDGHPVPHRDAKGSEWADFAPAPGTLAAVRAAQGCRSRHPRLNVLCELLTVHEGVHRSPGLEPSDPDIMWADEDSAAADAADDEPRPAHHWNHAEYPCHDQDEDENNEIWLCTAQRGHSGPVHIAYGDDGEPLHTWPVTYDTRMACGDTLADAAPYGEGAPMWCPRHGETTAITEAQWLEEHPAEPVTYPAGTALGETSPAGES